jgi:hypothetical protein
VVGYNEFSPLATRNAKDEAPVWDSAATFVYNVFFVPGTDCVVFSASLVPSIADYGLRATQGWPGQNNKNRLYNPYGYSPDDDGPGPMLTGFYFSDSKQYLKFFVYKVSELASVVSGAIGYNAVKPRAIFTLPMPYFYPNNAYFGTCSYDDVNNRLYVTQSAPVDGSSRRTFINVYSCSKFVP